MQKTKIGGYCYFDVQVEGMGNANRDLFAPSLSELLNLTGLNKCAKLLTVQDLELPYVIALQKTSRIDMLQIALPTLIANPALTGSYNFFSQLVYSKALSS